VGIQGQRAAPVSPLQRSLELLREQGYVVDIVERRLPRCAVTKDLFGIADLLCLRGEEIVAVQCTSRSHVSHRQRKIAEAETLPAIRKAGIRVLIHGWGKMAGGRWECRVVDCS